MKPTPKLREAVLTTPGNPAPWSPVPLHRARQFIHQHPDAQLDAIFPTVYEEDRTAKITDLGTANQLGVITHKRMSEQIAQELGFPQYEYEEEQAEIKREKQAQQMQSPFGQPGLGVGDSLMPVAQKALPPARPGGMLKGQDSPLDADLVGPGVQPESPDLPTRPQPLRPPRAETPTRARLGNTELHRQPMAAPQRAGFRRSQK